MAFAASFSSTGGRPQSARLDGLAQSRKMQARPRTPMIFGPGSAPELVRLNPPPIWMMAPIKNGKLQGLPWKCESIPPPEQLRIHVKGQFGQLYLCKVYPEDTVLAMKKQIKDQGGVVRTQPLKPWTWHASPYRAPPRLRARPLSSLIPRSIPCVYVCVCVQFPEKQRMCLYNAKYNKSLSDSDVIGDFPGIDDLGVRLFEELK